MKTIITNWSDFKNKWEVITSNPKKMVNGKRLMDIVKNAYKNTNLGSFVKTMRDVLKSVWEVIDIKNDGEIDACIFYRKERVNENWIGYKIQGIGHDGDMKSKKVTIDKLVDLLEDSGYWIEASGKLEEILVINNSKKITDINILKKLYPNSIIKLKRDGSYSRTLESGDIINESTFGNPKFKNLNESFTHKKYEKDLKSLKEIENRIKNKYHDTFVKIASNILEKLDKYVKQHEYTTIFSYFDENNEADYLFDINLDLNGENCFLVNAEFTESIAILDIQTYEHGREYTIDISRLKTDDIYWLIKGLMEIPIVITLMNKSSFKKMNERYINLFDTFAINEGFKMKSYVEKRDKIISLQKEIDTVYKYKFLKMIVKIFDKIQNHIEASDDDLIDNIVDFLDELNISLYYGDGSEYEVMNMDYEGENSHIMSEKESGLTGQIYLNDIKTEDLYNWISLLTNSPKIREIINISSFKKMNI